MIQVKNLTKKYGNHLAVDDISFQVKKGHIYGLLGPNGAGKSTTMNIITGYIAPTSGSVTIDGHIMGQDTLEAKKCIGYLPEIPPLYPDMFVKEYLDFVLEQISELEEITYRAMMGEFILYYRGKIIGGIYDDRLLVKPVKSAISLMPTTTYELPYEGAKEMLLVDNIDSKEFLKKLFDAMYNELPVPKKMK